MASLLLPPWLCWAGMAIGVSLSTGFALGFWLGRCWADLTTVPGWCPRWIVHLLNWRRGL